jgi:hypothetical protein
MSCCSDNKKKLKCKCVPTVSSVTSFNVISPNQDFNWKTFQLIALPYGGTGLDWNDSDVSFWFDRISYADIINVKMTSTDSNVEYIYFNPLSPTLSTFDIKGDVSVQAVDIYVRLLVAVPVGTVVPLTFTYSGGGTERIAIGNITLN